MNHPLLKLNDEIKKEADHLLYKNGLLTILEKYGTPHISGSYYLNLMTWRDLDIYLEVDEQSETNFFSLGGDIASSLHPVKMHFRNELIAQTKGLPLGLYWGIYFGNERTGAWKIDIWCVKAEECKRLMDYCSTLNDKITPESSVHIMNIKSQCWTDPLYRKSYTSTDIYTAVLEKNIHTSEAFKDYIMSQIKNL